MRMDGCGRREQGSRDWRMLPVALTVWAAALGTRWLFAAVMEPASDGWWTDIGVGWVVAAGAFGAAAGGGMGIAGVRGGGRAARPCRAGGPGGGDNPRACGGGGLPPPAP